MRPERAGSNTIQPLGPYRSEVLLNTRVAPAAIVPVLRAAALSILASACAPSGTVVGPEPLAPAPAAPAPAAARWTAEDLEALRAVALDYYLSERPEHWEAFTAELERGAIFLEGELYEASPPAVGIWQLLAEQGGTALLRQPPVPKEVPALLFYWGLSVVREGRGWRVAGDFYRVEELVAAEPADPERR